MSLTFDMNSLAKLRATSLFVLMYSGIVMGISCCAKLILCLNHIGELQLYLYSTHYHPFLLLYFYVFVTLVTVLFLFLGASIVGFDNLNLKRTADLVL